MEHPNSEKTQKFVNAMQGSEFASVTQSPKFLALLQKPEFWAMMQTPQFQSFLKALEFHQQNRNLKSYAHIQETLEDLLETEALEDLFHTGIFSDYIRIKHHIMKEIDEYKEYQGAKQLYTEGGLTEDMVDDCKKTLRNTQAYKELIDAANAEMFPAHKNIANKTSKIFSADNDSNTTTASSTTQSQQSINPCNFQDPANDETAAFLSMTQTPQYQAYAQATKLHEKHNTLETKGLLEEALGLLIETPESKLLLQLKEQQKAEANNAQEYSDHVLTKNLAMEQTPEYKQYQEAKLAYEQNPNEDTKYMVDLCKAELRSTREGQEWLHATDQEQHVTNNIVNSEKWKREQQYPRFQDNTSIIENRNNAWLIVQNTKEYQRFSQAKLDHERYNNEDTLYLVKEHQKLAKETPEYKTYFALEQQRRAITGEPRTNNSNNDCFIQPKGPKIDIPLTSPNNNYSPRETCVPREIQLQLTNNKK